MCATYAFSNTCSTEPGYILVIKQCRYRSKPSDQDLHCYTYERRHEISINAVRATTKGSDQPLHTHSLIRAFDSRFAYSGNRRCFLGSIQSAQLQRLVRRQLLFVGMRGSRGGTGVPDPAPSPPRKSQSYQFPYEYWSGPRRK